ncbi:MAG: hypothetical protein SCI25_13535 [Desulfuromonadales bacterium]|nr:hypothetical protein [Desulfuromonadales bacterium]MDW7757849.1 hypothetical protein [Desulfuromonadales bacterium]
MKCKTIAITLAGILGCGGFFSGSGWAGAIPEATYQVDCRGTIDSWVMSGVVKRGDCYCPSSTSEPVCSFSSSGSSSSGSSPAYRPSSRPKSNPNAELSAYVTGMVVQQLLNLVFAPPSTSAAEAEKARAQAEWEQQQQILKARQERAQQATRLRSAWDQRDKESSEALSDFFSVPGSAYNGGDAVALNGDGIVGVVPILGTGAPEAPLPSMASRRPALNTTTSALQEDILNKGAESAHEVAWSSVKDAIFKALPDRWENARQAVEHIGEVRDWTGELLAAMEPETLTAAAASARPEKSWRVLDSLDSVSRKAPEAKLAEEMEVGVRLLRGEELAADQAKTYAFGFLKGFLVEKGTEGMLSGGF